MSKHAWTPGPWLFRAKSDSFHESPPRDTNYTYGRAFVDWTPDGLRFRNEADLDLMLLAPEMAAAILEHDDLHGMAGLPLGDVANRLRALSRPAEEATP